MNAAGQRSPAISGSLVVWEDGRNGNSYTCGKDQATGVEFPVHAEETDERLHAFSRSIVLWFERARAYGSLWTKDISVGERISIVDDGAADAAKPAIDGSIIAWVSHRILGRRAIVAEDISRGTEYLVISYSLGGKIPRPAVSGDLVVSGVHLGTEVIYAAGGCMSSRSSLY
jgi:beta propeller repeat protein